VSAPTPDEVREAWTSIFRLSPGELWRYRAAILLFVGVAVQSGLRASGVLIFSTAVPAIVLALSVLIPLRKRYRGYPDRPAAVRASRHFFRYVLMGKEP
jgi:hypothetical protein